jgi:hypothetical protein
MGKPGRPRGMPTFHRVAKAKEILASKAAQLAKDVLKASRVASERGNHLPAVWALEHISVLGEDGKTELRPIAPGIDRQQLETGSRAPTINIGWVIGPAAPIAALPPAQGIIEVEPEPTD